MKSGIYVIENLINGKRYLGSSKNIKKRFKRHIRELNNGNHHNVYLQNSCNKYGAVNFKLKVIEICFEYELLELEQKYLNEIFDNVDCNSKYYNIGKMSCGGDNITNNPNLNSILKRKSEIMIERYSSMSDEDKKLLSINLLGDKNPNYGNKWSDENKIKQSNKLKEYYNVNDNYIKGKTWDEYYNIDKSKKLKTNLSKIASMRVGDKNPFYGRKHNNETKNIISMSNKDKKNLSQLKPFKINDKVYLSLVDAQNELNISYSTIRYRLISDNIKYNNYVYITDEYELECILHENKNILR